MALNSPMVNRRWWTLNTNGRTATMSLSQYTNAEGGTLPQVRNFIYLEGVRVKNTTGSNITLYNPRLVVNNKEIQYDNVEMTIPANSVRFLGREGLNGNVNTIQIQPTLNIALGSNVPQGIVIDSNTTVWDSSNVMNVPNAGAKFTVYYNTVEIEPTNLQVVGTANIYEDIVITGTRPAGTQFFAILERDYSRSEKPIRKYEGYTDRTIIKAGYFENTSGGIIIMGYRRTPADTLGYGQSWGVQPSNMNLVAIKPSISSLNTNTNVIESPITVSWSTLNQTKYELEVVQNGVVIYTKAETTTRNNFVIPANTITNSISTVFRVRVMKNGNIAWSDWSSTTKSLVYNSPTIDNLTTIGNQWERPITVNWRSTFQTGYEYELYYNNVRTKTGNGTTSTTFEIPANTFTGTLPASVRVRVKRVINGQTLWTNWAERNISLQNITATISNLTVSGDFWEKSILVSWQSNDQQQFRLEVLRNNVVVNTFNGTTAKQFIIPADTLQAGGHVIRVWVAYANRFVNNQTRNVNLKDITPTVGNLALSGSNIDLDLILSWDSTDQQTYKVTISKTGSTPIEYTGTTAKQLTIPHNTLTTGLWSFKVDVFYKTRMKSSSINATLVETFPSIGVLEPDGVIVERDNPIRIWWTSQNQTSWRIEIDGGLLSYTGTTQKEYILPPATLATGDHSIVLTVTYTTAASVNKSVSKTAEFIVQGNPPRPTITSVTINTNRPVIEWDTQDQQGYILEILQGDKVVYATEWQNGLVDEYKVTDYLPNGGYVVRVKIMNQYELQSDYGTRSFTINANVSTDIHLDTLVFENYIQLSWDNIGGTFDKFYIMRNGEVVGKTTDTYYSDFTAHRECTYIVRGVTSNDIYKDSNKSYEIITIKRAVISTVDKVDDMMQIVVMTEQSKFNGSLSINHTLVHLSGRELPISIFGEHKTNTYNLSLEHCDDPFKFIEMYSRRQVFCYRDNLEKIFFTIPSLPYDRSSRLIDFEADISLFQVDYSEEVAYD